MYLLAPDSPVATPETSSNATEQKPIFIQPKPIYIPPKKIRPKIPTPPPEPIPVLKLEKSAYNDSKNSWISGEMEFELIDVTDILQGGTKITTMKVKNMEEYFPKKFDYLESSNEGDDGSEGNIKNLKRRLQKKKKKSARKPRVKRKRVESPGRQKRRKECLKYVGVSWNPQRKQWCVARTFEGVQWERKFFPEHQLLEAAHESDRQALEIMKKSGRVRRLNFPKGDGYRNVYRYDKKGWIGSKMLKGKKFRVTAATKLECVKKLNQVCKDAGGSPPNPEAGFPDIPLKDDEPAAGGVGALSGLMQNPSPRVSIPGVARLLFSD